MNGGRFLKNVVHIITPSLSIWSEFKKSNFQKFYLTSFSPNVRLSTTFHSKHGNFTSFLWNLLSSFLTRLVFHLTYYFLLKLCVKTWTTFLRNPPPVYTITSWCRTLTNEKYHATYSLKQSFLNCNVCGRFFCNTFITCLDMPISDKLQHCP